jgi:hypothetical protein
MKITDQVKNICRIGQGANCCKYLVIGQDGFECMKVNKDDKIVVDESWKRYEHVAQGDNCEGVKDFSLLNLKD